MTREHMELIAPNDIVAFTEAALEKCGHLLSLLQQNGKNEFRVLILGHGAADLYCIEIELPRNEGV